MGQSAEGMEHRAKCMEDSAKSTELIEFGKRQAERVTRRRAQGPGRKV